MTSRTSDLQINLNGFFSPSPPSARRALPGAPVARNSLMPYVAAITKLYLRAVTRQVLQNRCPHGVESTSFQVGNPIRGSRQIGHWRGSSDILIITTFHKFPHWCIRKFVNYCHPCHSGQLWTAVSYSDKLCAKIRWNWQTGQKAGDCEPKGKRLRG